MAQSAFTVTTPNPTPPTNMGFHGATPPNVPNYTKLSYASPLTTPNVNPPPYLDVDASTAGPLQTFATNAAASASGTGATSGGTEGSYPGTGTAPFSPNLVGAVPAASSVAHEGSGSEVTVLAPGNIIYTYPGGGTLDMSRTASTGPVQTAATLAAGPNATHASSLSPAANPTFTSFTAGSSVSGVGTTTLSCVTVGATKQSVVYVNGVAQTTVFVSPTSLTCAAVTKKTTPGNWDIKIVTAGVVETAPRTWTFT